MRKSAIFFTTSLGYLMEKTCELRKDKLWNEITSKVPIYFAMLWMRESFYSWKTRGNNCRQWFYCDILITRAKMPSLIKVN